MEKICNGVYFIPGRDEFLPDAHVYIIGDPASKDLSIVDAGLVGKGGDKIKAIEKLGFDLSSVKRIIMTHTHLDHIGCLAEMRRSLPGAEVWMHKLEADQIEGGDERTVYGMEMFKTMCQAQFGLVSGDFTFAVDRKLHDGEKLEIGGMVWEIIHIPGHSMGSIALYEAENKALIPGDVIYADYAIGRFDLYGADAGQLKASLARLSEMDIDILLPGHNEILKGVPADYIKKTAKMWGSYLA